MWCGNLGDMADEEHDKQPGDDAQARLDEAMRQLDALPPDFVRRALLDAGLPEKALDALVDVARHAEDPADRAEARRVIDEYGLGLALFADEEPPTPGV